jgi:hypothetical protein
VERSVCQGAAAASASRPAASSASRSAASGPPASSAGAGHVPAVRPAELRGVRRAPGQPLGGGRHAVQPGGGLQREGDRHRVLGEGAAGHRGLAVLGDQAGHRGGLAGQRPLHRAHRVPQAQHQRGVEHVLRGQAPVHIG